ncbi:MAG: DinB family protein [Acidobacteriia bacterium]|nr:DinB family protein [Terriglobia bacterium]
MHLESAIARAVGELRAIPELEAGNKPDSDQWSKKEELGHLIDSAANNHIRFVCATIQPKFHGPGYQQNDWVGLHGYAEMPWAEIIDFWQRYNLFLAGMVRRIPDERLQTSSIVGDSEPVTLGFLIEDYVAHMQHHLDHIFERQ